MCQRICKRISGTLFAIFALAFMLTFTNNNMFQVKAADIYAGGDVYKYFVVSETIFPYVKGRNAFIRGDVKAVKYGELLYKLPYVFRRNLDTNHFDYYVEGKSNVWRPVEGVALNIYQVMKENNPW